MGTLKPHSRRDMWETVSFPGGSVYFSFTSDSYLFISAAGECLRFAHDETSVDALRRVWVREGGWSWTS